MGNLNNVDVGDAIEATKTQNRAAEQDESEEKANKGGGRGAGAAVFRKAEKPRRGNT